MINVLNNGIYVAFQFIRNLCVSDVNMKNTVFNEYGGTGRVKVVVASCGSI